MRWPPSTDNELLHELPDDAFRDFRVLADQGPEVDAGDYQQVHVGSRPTVGGARRVAQDGELGEDLSFACLQPHGSALSVPDDLDLALEDYEQFLPQLSLPTEIGSGALVCL